MTGPARRGGEEMTFKKFGTGEVTETEGSLAKTASNVEFTEDDQRLLREENEAAKAHTDKEN